MNGVQTAFVTTGYNVVIDTCSPEIWYGYEYEVDIYYHVYIKL